MTNVSTPSLPYKIALCAECLIEQSLDMLVDDLPNAGRGT